MNNNKVNLHLDLYNWVPGKTHVWVHSTLCIRLHDVSEIKTFIIWDVQICKLNRKQSVPGQSYARFTRYCLLQCAFSQLKH